MPYHVAEATANDLDYRKKSMKGSKILLFGLSLQKRPGRFARIPTTPVVTTLPSFIALKLIVDTRNAPDGWCGIARRTSIVKSVSLDGALLSARAPKESTGHLTSR